MATTIPAPESAAVTTTTIVAEPSASDATADDDPGGVRPEGFGRTAAIVTEPDGTECELCLWLADDADQRRRGLMHVTDLGGADGMAFRYGAPHTGNFWMKNTVLPLSIAFFDPSGAYMSEFDMEPCLETSCPRYRTPPYFVIAVETLQSGLPDLGIGPDSTLELLDLPC